MFQRFRDFHAAAFTTATGVDLCFHNPDRAAQGFRSFDCFFYGHARNTARNRHSVFSEDFFALILMDFHAGFPSDADVYKSVDTAKCVMLDKQMLLRATRCCFVHPARVKPAGAPASGRGAGQCFGIGGCCDYQGGAASLVAGGETDVNLPQAIGARISWDERAERTTVNWY
ncbi:hypothetical protein JOD97_005468 [Duganella sp. 1411]|nr:hypothetical protein [Duganella sp. 1411]